MRGQVCPIGSAACRTVQKERGAAMTGSMFPGGLRRDGLPTALSDRRRVGHQAPGYRAGTGLDYLAEVAAAVTGCGRAFITLVDEDRSFWKSCLGVDARRTGDRWAKPGRG